MTLGEKIYKLRTEHNLSQGELSEKLEVSRQSISKWENNAAVPDLDKIIKLSDIFGITIDELVKSENVVPPEETAPALAAIKKESGFPPRKIIGTVLLSLSFAVVFVCFIIGGFEGVLSGILFSSPLILSGIVCFVFKKNVGLWCAWAVFFAIDMFLRIAVGTNSSSILNFRALLFYIRGGEFIRLILSFFQLAAVASLIIITVLRFMKKPLESKKPPLVFWAVFAFMRIAYAIFAASSLYTKIMHYLLSHAEIWTYSLFSSVYVWIYTCFFIAAVIFTARYIFTEKHKNI